MSGGEPACVRVTIHVRICTGRHQHSVFTFTVDSTVQLLNIFLKMVKYNRIGKDDENVLQRSDMQTTRRPLTSPVEKAF